MKAIQFHSLLEKTGYTIKVLNVLIYLKITHVKENRLDYLQFEHAATRMSSLTAVSKLRD